MTSRIDNLTSGRRLFSPRLIKNLQNGSSTLTNINIQSVSGSRVGKNSFEFDSPGSPLKSTQQLPIDWSRFEKHTFFNSAESKVNVAFDTIINYFPFDGTREELDDYYSNLDGYDKYILDKFPKHRGFLHFSGTQPGEDPAGRICRRT